MTDDPGMFDDEYWFRIEDRVIPLASLPENEQLSGPPPSSTLVNSLRRLGQTTPILAEYLPGSVLHYQVLDGRRRVKALRELYGDGESAMVVARVVFGLNDEVRQVLALSGNAARSANPISDLDTISALTRAGHSHTDIARVTGMKTSTIRKRLRLATLRPALRQAIESGAMAVTVAEQAAKLSDAAQEQLERVLDAEGRVTARRVRDAWRDHDQVTSAELAGMEGLSRLQLDISVRADNDYRTTVIDDHGQEWCVRISPATESP